MLSLFHQRFRCLRLQSSSKLEDIPQWSTSDEYLATSEYLLLEAEHTRTS